MTSRRRHRIRRSRRRRRLRRFLPAALLCVAIVGTATLLWSQDSGSDGNEKGPSVVVSEVVYPDTPEAIIFSHEAHASTACSTCHGAASTSERASQDLSPSMQTCAGCHGGGGAKPALQDCAGCHSGYDVEVDEPIESPEDWRAVRPAPMEVKRPQANLRFDHKGHIERAARQVGTDPSTTCQSCHAPDGEGHPQMPSMESCQSCHNGSVADDACTTCHMTAGTGRLDTTFTDPSSGQKKRLRPSNHSVAWLERHAQVARANGNDCASCHTEDDCAGCHQADVAGAFSAHPPNFELVHMAEARANPGNCSDCHKAETFCAGCHARTDVLANPPHDPPVRVDFHPPGWLDASMPDNHAVAARQDISQCASCHQEQDCVTCHRGINPHPPEFSFNCGRMLDANARPCLECHTDVNTLRALCR